MIKSSYRLFAPLVLGLMAANLAGCGSLPLTGAASGVDDLAAGQGTTKGLRYALGAKLSGRKVVDDERRYRTQDSLPDQADLRSQCSPIADQGHMGACTAFAIAKGLDEFLTKKEGHLTSLSPAFLYYEERKTQGNTDMTADSGAMIETGMKVLEQLGTCPESDDPYLSAADQKDPAKIKTFLATAPSATAVTAALNFRIPGAKSFITPGPGKKLKPVPLTTMSAIRASLAGGMPVVAGITVFQSMMSDTVAKTGNVPMPNPQAGDKAVGGHAIMLVGYDQTKQVFIVRNSWSTAWGDQGYFYLPYDYVHVGLMQDAWTATEN